MCVQVCPVRPSMFTQKKSMFTRKKAIQMNIGNRIQRQYI